MSKATYWWGLGPAMVVIAAVTCGLMYGLISSLPMDRSGMGQRVRELCTQATEIRLGVPPKHEFVCRPPRNGEETKARMLWSIGLGITFVTGLSCLAYGAIAAWRHGAKRGKFSALGEDASFAREFVGLSILSASVMVVIVLIAVNSDGLQFVWRDPFQSAIPVLFKEFSAPSGARSVPEMVAHIIVPIETLILCGALAVYISVCAASTASIEPYDPDQVLADPNEFMHVVAARFRLLNQVIAVASAAMSLGIACVAAYSAWPAALVKGAAMGKASDPLEALGAELTDVGTASTLHWAASVVSFAIPAYLIAVLYLASLARRQARAAIERTKPAGSEKDRFAAETGWMNERGVDLEWTAILKNMSAVLSPLVTGAAASALISALGGG